MRISLPVWIYATIAAAGLGISLFSLLSPQSGSVDQAAPTAMATAADCEQWPRPLNPGGLADQSHQDRPDAPASALDRQFYLSYERATAGDFAAAIEHYRRAAELARCDCERAHADAGVQAAQEAAALLDKDGMAARPTQLFWARLRELTQGLPCVRIQ
jgi:hypothetical protein